MFLPLAWDLTALSWGSITSLKIKASRTGSHQCPVNRLGFHPLSTKYRRPQAILLASLFPPTIPTLQQNGLNKMHMEQIIHENISRIWSRVPGGQTWLLQSTGCECPSPITHGGLTPVSCKTFPHLGIWAHGRQEGSVQCTMLMGTVALSLGGRPWHPSLSTATKRGLLPVWRAGATWPWSRKGWPTAPQNLSIPPKSQDGGSHWSSASTLSFYGDICACVLE